MGATKRKRSIKAESDDTSDHSLEAVSKKLKTTSDSKPNNKKGAGPGYTDEQDTFLAETARNQGDKKNWKEVARLYH